MYLYYGSDLHYVHVSRFCDFTSDIQMELCEGGTLEDQIKNGHRFSEDQLREITRQVTSVC